MFFVFDVSTTSEDELSLQSLATKNSRLKREKRNQVGTAGRFALKFEDGGA